MKLPRIIITCLCLAAIPALAAPPTVGQWELREKAANGMISHGITWADGQVIVLDDDVPTAITLDAAAVGLGSVENTAVSTWAGSANITTLGTITTGTWQGGVIAPAYLGSGSSITTKYLRGDGTWQTISTTVAIDSTTVTGGTTGRVLVVGSGGVVSETAAIAVSSGALTFTEDITLDTTGENIITFSGAGASRTIRGNGWGDQIIIGDVIYVGDGMQLVGPLTLGLTNVEMRASAANVLTLGPYGGGTAAQRIEVKGPSGTNAAGSDLTLASGRGTGNAAGGAVIVQTSTPGASGSTPGTLTTRMRVDDAGVAIGANGAPIAAILSGVAMIDWPNMSPGQVEAETITVTGAAEGDVVILGLPAVGGATHILYRAHVSAADTVYIEAVHAGPTGSGDEDPADAAVRATVIQH